MKKSNKETALKNDDRILQLAFYHESRGMLKQIKDFDKVTNRFTEFKLLIKRGSFTIKELEESVYLLKQSLTILMESKHDKICA